jgi:hypothetical protein
LGHGIAFYTVNRDLSFARREPMVVEVIPVMIVIQKTPMAAWMWVSVMMAGKAKAVRPV